MPISTQVGQSIVEAEADIHCALDQMIDQADYQFRFTGQKLRAHQNSSNDKPLEVKRLWRKKYDMDEGLREKLTMKGAAIGQGAFGIVYGRIPKKGQEITLVKKYSLNLGGEERENALRNAKQNLRDLMIHTLIMNPRKSKQLRLVINFKRNGITSKVTLPFLGDRSLEKAIDLERKGGLGRFLNAALTTMQGLQKLHAAGIVHRDIKPENIRSSADGTSSIIDFGLSLFEAHRGKDQRLGLAGTSYFIPLNQLIKRRISNSQQSYQSDYAQDRYAFAISFMGILGWNAEKLVQELGAKRVLEGGRKTYLYTPSQLNARYNERCNTFFGSLRGRLETAGMDAPDADRFIGILRKMSSQDQKIPHTVTTQDAVICFSQLASRYPVNSIDQLKKNLLDAIQAYLGFNGVNRGLFHRHAQAGRNTASVLQAKIDAASDVESLKQLAIDQINGQYGGNLNKHSLRTYLLAAFDMQADPNQKGKDLSEYINTYNHADHKAKKKADIDAARAGEFTLSVEAPLSENANLLQKIPAVIASPTPLFNLMRVQGVRSLPVPAIADRLLSVG
ncbi:MAG: protein kinase [Gammaproteobacteria bacterium]|nr:protein kinase [Gammaproteobacteria bacterium]